MGKPYVQEVIQRHRSDERVLFWEIFNGPNLHNAYSVRLREAGYAWAKEKAHTAGAQLLE